MASSTFGADFWDGFEQDPRTPEHAHLRASDRDRDVVLGLLGNAYADGRLTREEFDERSTNVASARTLGDLPAIVNDLIATTPALPSATVVHAEAVRRYRADRREALTYLGPAIICWVIWAWVLVGNGGTAFPWPIFVTMGTAMPAIRLWMNPEDHIASRQRKLEQKIAAGEPPVLEAPENGSDYRHDYWNRRDRYRDRRRRR